MLTPVDVKALTEFRLWLRYPDGVTGTVDLSMASSSKMFFGDHAPPHIHAEYGNDQVLIDIQALAVFTGKLPPRAMGMVVEWVSQH